MGFWLFRWLERVRKGKEFEVGGWLGFGVGIRRSVGWMRIGRKYGGCVGGNGFFEIMVWVSVV